MPQDFLAPSLIIIIFINYTKPLVLLHEKLEKLIY